MSDNIQVPIAQLQELQTKFTMMREELDAAEKGATELQGVDTNDGYLVAEAVAHFLSEWQQSRQTLNKNIGILGEVSGKIALTTAEHDGTLASSINQATGTLKGGD
ncbi:MAG: hypothetical protein Q4A82_07270 [Corynebacterium sp.]|nr:hypothetical protein [Corynebacterium sp.]